MLRYPKKFIIFCSPYRFFHQTSIVLNDFYSVLGVNPKSTQAQIKEAYYKLSKLYHPDMNPDEEALKKFRDVNQAYEILSNLKTKKLYDKGIIRGVDEEIRKEETPEEKFYRSLDKKHKVPTYGKTTIYDFDKWTQEHYSETFKTEKGYKDYKVRQKIRAEEENKDENSIIYFVLILIVVCFVIICYDYKKPDFFKKEKPTK